MLKKVDGGYKIQSHTKPGHVYPKVYKTKEEAEKRIEQMMAHKDKKEEKK